MYDIQFTATSGSDWSQAIEVINDQTNGPLTEVSEYRVEIAVKDRDDYALLSGNTDSGEVVFPSPNIIQWTFPKERFGGFCRGTTYSVGCRLIDDDLGTFTLFTGSLAYIDGEF